MRKTFILQHDGLTAYSNKTKLYKHLKNRYSTTDYQREYMYLLISTGSGWSNRVTSQSSFNALLLKHKTLMVFSERQVEGEEAAYVYELYVQ